MKAPKIILLLFFFYVATFGIKAQQNLDHAIWDQLLVTNVSDTGNVNYKGFIKNSDQLSKYFKYLSVNTPKKNWSKEETLAYWINVYNAYTVKLIMDNYPIKSIKDIKDPWGKAFFKINGKPYSLNTVEHKILRKLNDPRIHFAINCASYSCPTLWNRAYTANNINKALETQTKKFINDPSKNRITEEDAKISKIFSWFRKDFKINEKGVYDFINQYAVVKIDAQRKKGYKNYNWSLNE